MLLKRELDYFLIEGAYGGSQDWFSDHWMKLGGCGAVVACDSCIYLDIYKNTGGLYPYVKSNITKEDYIRFGMKMKPYLSPRMTGINRTDIYIDGFMEYVKDMGVDRGLSLYPFEGNESVDDAKRTVKDSIDRGFPVASLTLHHRNKNMEDYVWHWYLLNGYEEYEDKFMVKAVTYGNWQWLDFDVLWDTGYSRRGGLVLYDIL